MSSVNKLAFRGAVWTVVGYGMSQGLRLVSNLILTRLLVPEMFGLMAVANTFIVGLQLFSDIGINASIIQNKRGDDPDFLNTAWTIQIIRGFVLWLFCLAITWPVAHFYQTPQLVWIIPILGLNSIIGGFASTSVYTLNRQVAVDKLTILSIGVQIFSLIIMNVWAWFNPTIWSLVIGSLAGEVLRMVLTYRLIPKYSNHFTWDRDAVTEIFSYGKWIFVSTLTSFLGSQTDKLILAKLLSFHFLGIYNVAITLAAVPQQIIESVSWKVIFPVISQQADLPRSTLRAKILQKRRLILVTAIPLLALLASFGDVIISVLYDTRYHEAGWMLSILAIGTWLFLLTTTGTPVLLAIGKPLYSAYGNLLKICYMVIGLPLGVYFLGDLGAIIVIAANDCCFYGVVSYGLWREKLSLSGQDLQISLMMLGLFTLMISARYFLGFGFPLAEILEW